MQRELKVEVLKTFSKSKIGNKGQKKLMMVKYNNGAPQLVSQYYYLDKEGEMQPGKFKGLTAEDWAVLVKKHKTISRVFKEG